MNVYRPVGTAVLVRLLPPQNENHNILLPDGSSRPGDFQLWEIMAIGNEVNEANFQLKVGETALLGGGHPGEGIMVDPERKIMLFDRRRVVCIVEQNGTNN